MLFFLLCLLSFSYAYGGSRCPNRTTIYPCICIDNPIGKSRFDTTVVCQSLMHGEALKAIEPGLSSTEIDKFLLYDSYWSRPLQANGRIPLNYISTFRMKSVKVVDTIMVTFACPQRDCKTTYLKRFTAINITVSENPACNHTSIMSWVSCPESIEEITIDSVYKYEIIIRPDFFPVRFNKLKALHMPNNKITKIERRIISHAKFPVLETLDLSKNMLKDAKILFSSALKVKYLDLSYNSIRNVPDFTYLPNLRLLNMSNNHILSLLQNEWENVPSSFRIIDLTSNDLVCNCDFNWVNSTFHMNTVLTGHCALPPEVAFMKLRKASRLLNERCNKEGEILPAKISKTKPTVISRQ